jgi:uncharacterized membrane protein YadS
MAVPWGLVVFLIGIAYGYMSPGRQDKSQLFKKGLLWGLIIAIVVALLGFFFNANPLGLADNGFFGILISAIVLTLVFIVGVWLGDMVEGRRHTGPGLRRV